MLYILSIDCMEQADDRGDTKAKGSAMIIIPHIAKTGGMSFRDYLQACAGRFLRAAESAGPLPSES